jgi:hypothetical protein
MIQSIDSLIKTAEKDNLLPELHKILRETPVYDDTNTVIDIIEVKNYVQDIQNKYERIKYIDGCMNE